MNFFSEHMPPFSLPLGAEYAWKWRNDLNGFEVEIPNGRLLFIEHFFDEAYSSDTVQFLTGYDSPQLVHHWRDVERDTLRRVAFRNIRWKHEQILMFGKRVYQPRYTAWYGDTDKSYTYSGLKMQPEPWNGRLLDIKNAIEAASGTVYNSVLLNWYRDGADYMGWHADNEKELGQNPVIASVNFGATRRFLLRPKSNPSEKLEIHLKNGSLLVMSGAMQHYWQHAIPKELRVRTMRFNLTFRKIL